MGAKTGSDSLVVPTKALAELLQPKLDRIEAQYRRTHMEGSEGNTLLTGYVADAGPFGFLYNDMARSTDTTYESAPRRLWSILNKESLSTSLVIADAILLSLDISITETDLPILPIRRSAALEMIEARFEDRGREIDAVYVNKMAKRLVGLCRAYLFAVADPETVAEVRRKNAHNLVRRKAAREAELVAA